MARATKQTERQGRAKKDDEVAQPRGLRFRDEDWNRWKKKAKAEGCSLNEFLRRAADERAGA